MTLYPTKNQIEKKKQNEIKKKCVEAEINPIYGGGDTRLVLDAGLGAGTPRIDAARRDGSIARCWRPATEGSGHKPPAEWICSALAQACSALAHTRTMWRDSQFLLAEPCV